MHATPQRIRILILALALSVTGLGAMDQGRDFSSDAYRSTSGLHKLLVDSDDARALAQLGTATVVRTIDYGGFSLEIVPDATLALLDEYGLKRVQVRDHFDLLHLNDWTIDTRVDEPPAIPIDRKQPAATFPRQL
jgi:hypothetical protein